MRTRFLAETRHTLRCQRGHDLYQVRSVNWNYTSIGGECAHLADCKVDDEKPKSLGDVKQCGAVVKIYNRREGKSDDEMSDEEDTVRICPDDRERCGIKQYEPNQCSDPQSWHKINNAPAKDAHLVEVVEIEGSMEK